MVHTKARNRNDCRSHSLRTYPQEGRLTYHGLRNRRHRWPRSCPASSQVSIEELVSVANQPLAFAEMLVGGIFLLAGISGETLGNIMRGQFQILPLKAGATVPSGSGTGGSSGGSSGYAPGPGGPGLSGIPGNPITSSSYVGPLAPVLATIRRMESGNYSQPPNSGGASGAYQYIQSTWTTWANAAGFGQWANVPSYQAPPNVQDAVAAFNVKHIIDQYGSVAYVPLAWYYPAAIGNPVLLNQVPDPQAGNTLTPLQYQSAWLNTFNSITGNTGG